MAKSQDAKKTQKRNLLKLQKKKKRKKEIKKIHLEEISLLYSRN